MRARILSLSCMIVNADPRSTPVVRCASSHNTKSNCSPDSSWALATTSMLWYVVNTTVILELFRRIFGAMRLSSVLTPISISMMGMSTLPCDTVLSEHTPTYPGDMVCSSAHERMAWRISDIDGTAYSTRPPLPTIRSASRRAVSVLPVPHAMMSWPRSCFLRPDTTSLIARFW